MAICQANIQAQGDRIKRSYYPRYTRILACSECSLTCQSRAVVRQQRLQFCMIHLSGCAGRDAWQLNFGGHTHQWSPSVTFEAKCASGVLVIVVRKLDGSHAMVWKEGSRKVQNMCTQTTLAFRAFAHRQAGASVPSTNTDA